MIKSLPATEKEFDMKQVEQANPSWVRVVMIVFVMIIIFGAIWADWANAATKTKYYKISGDVTVLAFVGPIGNRVVDPVKYTTAYAQVITILHKKSGPGLWAFHLPGLVAIDGTGQSFTVESEGYFVAKRRQVKPFKYQEVK